MREPFLTLRVGNVALSLGAEVCSTSCSFESSLRAEVGPPDVTSSLRVSSEVIVDLAVHGKAPNRKSPKKNRKTIIKNRPVLRDNLIGLDCSLSDDRYGFSVAI